jgi:hypothetical protein
MSQRFLNQKLGKRASHRARLQKASRRASQPRHPASARQRRPAGKPGPAR